MSRLLVALLAVTTLVTGCETTTDDEMVPNPQKTVTRSASPTPTAAPASVPVGQGEVSADDVVWARGSVLHVEERSVDLASVGVDGFVVVPGGVFVLSNQELWFTDLSRLRGTALTGVTGLGATADRSRIIVSSTLEGDTRTSAYDTRTGRAVDSAGVEPASREELLGEVTGVQVRPGAYSGPVPEVFEPVGRAGESRVYGLARAGERATAVVACDTARRSCSRLAALDGEEPVVFGSGT